MPHASNIRTSSSPTLRIALVQTNPRLGDLDANADHIAAAAVRAHAAGADLVCTGELAVCGYPPEDLLLRADFLAACEAQLDALAAVVPVPAFVGCPTRVGDRATNALVLLADGAVVARYDKRELPTYGVFDERRVFAPGAGPLVVEIAGVRVAATICEDIWVPAHTAEAAALGAELLLNASASPYERGKPAQREQMLQVRARDARIAIAYANLTGGQDEIVFDGHSVVIGPDGGVRARGAGFAEDCVLADIDRDEVLAARLADTRVRQGPPPPAPALVLTSAQEASVGVHDRLGPAVATAVPAPSTTAADGATTPVVPATSAAVEATAAEESRSQDPPMVGRVAPFASPEAEVWEALVAGLRDYVRKNGFAGVVLGSSGGIDSAVTSVLAADALGAGEVCCVSMPSRYSSPETRADALEVPRRLGAEWREIPIEPMHAAGEAMLPGLAGTAAENLQARIRGMVLMGISNAEGRLLLTTGNKSETAVGFCTLYGDTAGGFAPLRDLPKTLVFHLASWRAAQETPAPIPDSVITRPPSAELAPGQRDEDTLPPYEVLDAILEAYIERRLAPARIAAAGIADAATVEAVVRRVDGAEFKRRQAPTGTRVSRVAFGRDRRLPITNGYTGV